MRKPMVTRTIQSTLATLMCVDTESGEVCNTTVNLPRTYKDEKAMLKAAAPIVETDTIKPVKVVDVSVIENLYGMSETDFIAHAALLPPRGGKDDAEDGAEADADDGVETDAE